MKLTKTHWAIILFNLVYLLIFAVYYISIKNYEFLWYIAVVVFFLILIGMTLHRTKFDYVILIGLSLWGFLHMAGGGIIVNGEVLYRYILIPLYNGGEDFFILKFDQFVHFFGFGVTTLVIYQLLTGHLNFAHKKGTIYFVAICASMGLGALNEIVEFIAVLVFPETGVGGYFNTSLDLVFNMFGAITGGVVDYLRRKRDCFGKLFKG